MIGCLLWRLLDRIAQAGSDSCPNTPELILIDEDNKQMPWPILGRLSHTLVQESVTEHYLHHWSEFMYTGSG